MENKIIVKKSKIHGKGVFATKNLKKGTKIIEYIGEKIPKEEGDRRAAVSLKNSKKDPNAGATYIFELNKKYDIDGNVSKNKARFINHSCSPNCKIEIIKDHIWIISKRNIKKGEELNYNYSYSVEDCLEHLCKCGSKNCVGYIVDPSEKKKLLKIINS